MLQNVILKSGGNLPFATFGSERVKKREGNWSWNAPAIVSGIVTGDVSVSYWLIFSPSLVTVPEVFAKVNSTQSLSRF